MLFSAGQVFLFWSQRKAHIQSQKICPGLRANHQQTKIKDQVVLDVHLEWAPFPAYITSDTSGDLALNKERPVKVP